MDEMPTSPMPQLSRAEQAHSYRKVKISYSAKTRKKLKDEGMVTVVAITGVPVQYASGGQNYETDQEILGITPNVLWP
jgi:hypothetical protein